MVHNLPENFNISDFDVFHSALLINTFIKEKDHIQTRKLPHALHVVHKTNISYGLLALKRVNQLCYI